MEKVKEYAFVIDKNGNPLSPTDINNAWKLIRTKKAKCIKYNPFTIKLKKEISDKEKDSSIFHIGIDDGSANVGFGITQYCVKNGIITRVKAIQKVTMEQRQDVKHLMDVRRGYRRNRRSEKRSRKCRYERATLCKDGRIAPTIKQKRQAVLRVVKFYQRRLNITSITLEDVSFDIRVLTEGKKLYGQAYTKSNRQDANIRNAVYMRDHGKCQLCGEHKDNEQMEVHHIHPRRMGGPDSIYNEILLCHTCHTTKVNGHELEYEQMFYDKIDGKLVKTDMIQHVQIGKTYLREELEKIGDLKITSGGDTANKRNNWNIPKTHSNDAICISCEDIKPDTTNVQEYIVKPMRHKRKSNITSMGFQLGDFVELSIRSNKEKKTIKVKGYITAFIKCQNGKDKGKLNISI